MAAYVWSRLHGFTMGNLFPFLHGPDYFFPLAIFEYAMTSSRCVFFPGYESKYADKQ